MRKLLYTAVIFAASVGSSVSAEIIRVDPSAIQGDNVLFNNGTQTGTTVFGNTNLGINTLAFTGTTLGGGTTVSANGGQAKVKGGGASPLTSLQFGLTGLSTFNNLELNLFSGTASSVTFNITDNQGKLFTFASLALGNGQNRFGFQGINNLTIRNVSATLNGGGIGDVRQIRLDGFAATSAVPEPSTWAMMLIGFGAIGYSMRSSKAGRSRVLAANA
jgi:hypothetical protein